jgi:hypothetical protein
MSPRFSHFDDYSIFDDKEEVKHLVESMIQDKDPEVTLERLRKMDYSYIFILSKKENKRSRTSPR